MTITPERWRTGRSVGRTIYRMTGPRASKGDELIGVMDTPELATYVVAAVNTAHAAAARWEADRRVPADDLRAHLVASLLASWSVADDRVSQTMARLTAGRDIGTVLHALKTHEVMGDVEDALSYVIETSEHDTTRFQRAREVLFPNAPREATDA